MRAQFINEINFERGKDPRSAMGIGAAATLEAMAKENAMDGYRWGGSDYSQESLIEEAKSDLLYRKIRVQDFETVRLILEQSDKIYKKGIKGSIQVLVGSAAARDMALKECNEKQEAAIEFMPYLISKGANPLFRGWASYKDACTYALPKIIKYFHDNFDINPHLDNDLPMRKLTEDDNLTRVDDYPDFGKRVWESMQVLLDEFKK